MLLLRMQDWSGEDNLLRPLPDWAAGAP
jgi:hypothetical protein